MFLSYAIICFVDRTRNVADYITVTLYIHVVKTTTASFYNFFLSNQRRTKQSLTKKVHIARNQTTMQYIHFGATLTPIPNQVNPKTTTKLCC